MSKTIIIIVLCLVLGVGGLLLYFNKPDKLCIGDTCINESEMKQLVKPDKLCIGDTCINESEMKQLVKPDKFCIGETCINESEMKQLNVSVYRSPIWTGATYSIKPSDFSPMPSKGYYQITIKRSDGNSKGWRYNGTIGVDGTKFTFITQADAVNIKLTITENGDISFELNNTFPDVFIFTLQPL